MQSISLFSRVWSRRSVGSRLVVVSLLTTLLALPFSQVAAGSNPTPVPVTNSVTEQRIGPTAAAQKLTLAFPLKVSNQAGLDQLLTSMYDPTSPGYKQFLSSQEFTQQFTNQSDRTDVDRYLTGQGFTVTDSGLGILVDATTTVAQAEKTFGITISDYVEKSTGKKFYRNDGPVNLPQTLASRITGVIGLSNNNHFYPRTMKVSPDKAQPKTNGTPGGCAGALGVANNSDSFTPNQLKTAYNFDPFYSQSVTGTGQTVAVYELDDYLDSNVATYQSCFGTSVPLQRVAVDGGVSSIHGGQSEVELDIEVIAGMAPGLTKIQVYEADGSGSSYLDEFQKIANDDSSQVVSISWGDCEGDPYITHSFLDSENTIFMQMASQGQSVFSASGDYGSNGCIPVTKPPDPGVYASDVLDNQYVTGVGGTMLTLNSDNTINNEITWNDFYNGGYGASGGGPSNYFARPTWQVGTGTNGQYSNGKRMTPDVSAAASPYTSYVVYTGDNGNAGSWGAIGGTSASSPLWAAAVALTNKYLVNNGQARLGFANPTIYRIYNSAGSTMTYHDITVGDDCYDATTGNHTSTCGTPNNGASLYPATIGYDMATEIGTLNAYNFARNSCMIQVTSSLDNGDSGTLRNLAAAAASPSAACKMIALSSGSVGSSTIHLNSGLTLSGGETVVGPACTSGPAFNITGGTGDGVTLTNGGIYGLKISGFSNRQLVAQAGPNYVGCVKASKN